MLEFGLFVVELLSKHISKTRCDESTEEILKCKARPVVAVAQLVESRIVIPVVVGSSPISHPKEYE